MEPSWARWKFDLTGDHGRVRAIWTVIIGGDDQDGCPVVLHEEPIQLDCEPIGDAGTKGDQLYFQGGHFACEFPDLLEEANKIILQRWGKDCLLAGTGEGLCAPMLFAYAKADLLLKSQSDSSIFYHPSLRFSLVVQKDDVQTYFYFGGEDSTSKGMPVTQGAAFESRCVRQGKDCRDVGAAAIFEHSIDNNDAGKEKKDYRPRVDNGPVTVYIGTNPNKQGFQGSITRLEVDPGCRVH